MIMKKKEAIAQLSKELAERKAMVKRGENVKESRRAAEMIEKKIQAIKKFS